MKRILQSARTVLKSAMQRRRWLAVLFFTVICAQTQAADIEWQGWSFDYSTNDQSSGLVLTNVRYGDTEILARISMPVMRVEYENDVCGPYAVMLPDQALVTAGQGTTDSACDNEALCRRTFTQAGEQVLEIGSNWQVGEHQIYQTYYFSELGYFDARVYSRGLQCNVNHGHHVHWLMDFDIAGAGNDRVRRENGTPEPVEFNDLKSNTTYWTIEDSITGDQIRIVPSNDDGEADIFSHSDVAVRAYDSLETGRWRLGARGEIGDNYLNEEMIDGQDIVFWYVSHKQRAAIPGSSQWHVSGPRIEIVNAEKPLAEPDTGPELGAAIPLQQGNLLANGDFEHGAGGWQDCGPDDSTRITTDTAYTGNNGMSINNAGCLYQEVDAQAGDELTLSCQALRDGSSWTIMELSFLDRRFNALSSRMQQINSSGNFTEHRVAGVAPDDTRYALVLMHSESETVFDTCVLSRGITETTDPGTDRNLLSNGGFEEDLSSWSSCAAPDKISLSNDANDGAQAVQVTNGGCLYQEFPVTPGNVYTVSCDARQTAGSATNLTIGFLNENYTSISSQELPVSGPTFTNYSATLTAPERSASGTVVMYSEDPGIFDSCTVTAAGNP